MRGSIHQVVTFKFKMATKRGFKDDPSSTSKKRQKTESKSVGSREVEKEVDFPRGGASSLTPLEVRRIRQQAEKDVLFGISAVEEKKTKKKKKTNSKDDQDKSVSEYEPIAKVIKRAQSLSFKNLCPGMKLLGAVKELNDYEVIISLPNGLSGFVTIYDVNDKITALLVDQEDKLEEEEDENGVPSLEDLFTGESLVACVVKEIYPEKHGHKKIRLSVKPDDINNGLVNISQDMVLNGCVFSEQDHGYVVSFGIPGKNGFLPKKPTTPENLKIGQPVQVFIKSADQEGRVITLSMDKEEIKSAMVTDDMKLKLTSLVPGMMVKVSAKEHTSSGVLVSFLGMFDGTVSTNHLPEHGQNPDCKYKKNAKYTGRILHVNPKSKSVALSLQTHVVDNVPCLFGEFCFGDVIDEATVRRMDQGHGLLMGLADDIHGYVHISHVSDAHVEKLGKKYKEDSEHRCRIIGFNALDGLVSLTMEKSVIEKPFLRYHDIKVGTVIECTTLTLERFGVLVSIARNIRGLVTNLHLADIILKHPEKKFNEGKSIKCRVLTVDPDKRHLQLTHKKTLVSSTLPILTQYTDAKQGMTTHGFITSIKEYGCIVTFYNRVKGLVPKAELGIPPQEDLRKVFYVGQVLTCHVLNCSPSEEKIRLSLKASSALGSTPVQQVDTKTGTMVDVDVIASSEEGLDVLVQPSGFPALLPVAHLSDHQEHCQPLLALYKPPGKPLRMSDVLYYGQGNFKSHIISLKPSLKTAAASGKWLRSFEELTVGMILPGFVKKIMQYGIFIEFAPKIFGLAPNSFIANQFVSDASVHFRVGQSVVAKVSEIDNERQRFLVSLKESDIMPESVDNCNASIAVDLLQDYLIERQSILDDIASKSEKAKKLLSLTRGSYIEAKVSSVKKHGINLQLAEGLQGFVPHQLAEGISCQEGEVVFGVVLDHDIDTMMACITLMPQIVESSKKAKETPKKKKKVKSSQVVDCSVQLIQHNYIIVCLTDHHHSLAIAPAKMHLNDIRDAAKRFVIGQKCSATVHSSQPCIVVLQEKTFDTEKMKPGAVTMAVIRGIKALQMNVKLEGFQIIGRVHICNTTDTIHESSKGKSPFKPHRVGNKIQVKVLGFRDTKTHQFLPVSHNNFTRAVAELSLKPSHFALSSVADDHQFRKLEDYQIGDEVAAYVTSATNHCVWMIVSPNVTGRISLLHASTNIKVLKRLTSHFKQGRGYTCYVLAVDTDHKVLDLSIAFKSDASLSKGQIVLGRITRVNPSVGLCVQLPLHKCGMAFLVDLYDHYLTKPLENFKERQIVKCYILGMKDDGHFNLSLRASRTEADSTENKPVLVEDEKPRDREYETLTDLDVGDLVKGYVKSASNAGVFVTLAHNITARIQIKNLSHFFVKDWKPYFPPSTLVRGKILSIDPSSGRIELSLKGKDTGLDDPVPNPKKNAQEKSKKRKKESQLMKTVDVDDDDSDDEVATKKLKSGDADSDDEEEEIGTKSDQSDEEEEDEVSSDEDMDVTARSTAVPRLQVSAGFDWNAHENGDVTAGQHSDESSASDTEATQEVSRKKTKRQKRAEKKAEEDFIYKTEQALLDQDRAPESADDFDRLVLTSPNSSVLWLQYMAFHLHTTEIEKARAVAERAIKTISFREEREKLNIWVALMNLENLYGAQESLVTVFERALQHNDPKKVFFNLITIYSKTDKNELAEQLFHSMTKRFSQSKKVWIEFGRFHMKNGKLESARKILQRALKSLPKRKHVESVIQFAIMEFKHGDPQRGQTVMEEVLSNYPKRSDLWSVYIDMMSKQGDPDVVRNIFERAIHTNFSSKKMKFLFKRYLAFEREHGDELSVEKVKTKAMEYVESKVALT